MANANNMTAEETKLQGILAAYLTSRREAPAAASHLDQDTLSAFSEGLLNERESAPVVSHLADCSFCRHITVELVRLELQFSDEPLTARTESAEPAKISAVLSNLFEKIFGSSENAVLAHEEKKDEGEKESEEDKKD